jgi:hypothetical protein
MALSLFLFLLGYLAAMGTLGTLCGIVVSGFLIVKHRLFTYLFLAYVLLILVFVLALVRF